MWTKPNLKISVMLPANWKSCAAVLLVLVFYTFGFPETGSGRECRGENAKEIAALLDLGLYGPL